MNYLMGIGMPQVFASSKKPIKTMINLSHNLDTARSKISLISAD
jgi:hypothetical protein